MATVSPPIQMACALRPSNDLALSATSDGFPAWASTSSIPSSAHADRALRTQAAELSSEGFQTTPIRRSSGFIWRAIRMADSTGWNVPTPAMYGRCWSGAGPVTPTPAP